MSQATVSPVPPITAAGAGPDDKERPTFRPFITATGYVHDDEERPDRLRAARRDEQSTHGDYL